LQKIKGAGQTSKLQTDQAKQQWDIKTKTPKPRNQTQHSKRRDTSKNASLKNQHNDELRTSGD